MIWMDAMFFNNNEVSEYNLGHFKQDQSMSKWSTGLAYVGNLINYLLYLATPFPRDLGIDL